MKKVWSLILALALLISMVSIVPAAAETAEVFRYDEPVTLKVSVFDRGNTGGTAVDDNYWSKWIQENFGVPRNIKIEWVVIPRSEEESKLATLMMDEASCPDICFTYNESIVTDYVNQGGIIEVSGLIDQYGQNLKKFLGDEVLEFGKFAGGQYAIPARRVVVAWMGMFLRSDWIEKLNRQMPTTKEEFRNMVEPLGGYRDDFTNVTDIQLFVSMSSSVGYRARDQRWSSQINYAGDSFDAFEGQPITIRSASGQTIPSGRHVFVRAAARINYDTPRGSGTRRWNYSEPLEVIIP